MTAEATPIPTHLLDIWTVYEHHARMVDAAAASGMSLALFKKRLRELYALLGVTSSQQAGRVLRERGII